jgi:hypothetical protein
VPEDDRPDEIEKLRQKWHAAEKAYDAALRQARAPTEIEALRERKERLKLAYLEKVKT